MDRTPPSFSQDNSFGSDFDSLLDLNHDNSLYPSPSVTRSSFSSTSATSSNHSTPSMSQNTVSPEFSGPSHHYDMHQQTLPISGDMGFGDPMFTNDVPIMQMDDPAFFYPEPIVPSSDMVQSISPLMTTVDEVHVPKSEPQPQRKMYYSGIHQEMYQQKMLQQQKATASTGNPREDQINQVLSTMKANYHNQMGSKNGNDMLPHIAKLKKEEDEMDEDERLLASEEGKKLSSKERRQLRNKVSARAFRSRRKEYISQLESEVSKKNQENTILQVENDRLKAENQRLEDLSKILLRSDAFTTFLNEMVTKGVDVSALQQQMQPKPQVTAAPEPKFNPARDRNPNVSSSEEWPLAYSWNPAPQVFAVEVPELPELPDLDGKALLDEDFTIADGFYPMVRNEKGDIDFSSIEEDDEDYYQPPEDLMDVLLEESEKKQNLDDLFPGVGVNQLLERLDKIAGGEAKPEDFFDVPETEQSVPEQTEQSKEDTQCPPSVCASNKILQEAEGVYRRIGLVVQ
ncbi:hypothetical protein EDC01DRAFT_782265 [Geopyxis carbonaria]|nr:hypothetical protein EDC01DRAFT_782265 [Geopyxis carbonaria]